MLEGSESVKQDLGVKLGSEQYTNLKGCVENYFQHYFIEKIKYRVLLFTRQCFLHTHFSMHGPYGDAGRVLGVMVPWATQDPCLPPKAPKAISYLPTSILQTQNPRSTPRNTFEGHQCPPDISRLPS